MTKFEHTDSWIFLSIARGHKDARPTLDKIIWMADGINKSVPNRAEIEGAINRLLSVGLIRIENGRFVVPQAARSVLDQVCQSAKSVFDEWDVLEKYFTTADLPGVSYTPWHLSESEFAAACEIYRRDFMEALKNLNNENHTT